mgnify:FL=1|jgi:F-type H+-transporting ATPase subunit delta
MTHIGREYAAALFSCARETGERFSDALCAVETLFADNPQYVALLSSPAVALSEREELIKKAFSDAVPPTVLHFLQVLCAHGHMAAFSDCVKEYCALEQAAERELTARIVSAAPLTEAQKERLCRRLSEKCGRTVTPEYAVDPSLVGGVIVYMDGKIMDGSLAHRLQNMKEAIETV